MIRKTLSIGTIGLVSFRSKSERLERAEHAQLDAEKSLEREHSARVAAERRAKHPKRKRAKRRDRKAEALALAATATTHGRRAGKRARKAAKRSMGHAKDAATTVKEAAAPKVDALTTRASGAIDQLTTHDS